MNEYTRQLLAAQWEFARKITELKAWLYANHPEYDISLGDAHRDDRCPYGSKSSAHHRSLAQDLNLFKNGVYCTSTEDHRFLGEKWERMGGIWGGRFKDGNHYEWPFVFDPLRKEKEEVIEELNKLGAFTEGKQ